MPTAQEILCRYLYGQTTLPSPNDLLDDRFIRPKGIDGPPVVVNAEDDMLHGGGDSLPSITFRVHTNEYEQKAITSMCGAKHVREVSDGMARHSTCGMRPIAHSLRT